MWKSAASSRSIFGRGGGPVPETEKGERLARLDAVAHGLLDQEPRGEIDRIVSVRRPQPMSIERKPIFSV